MNLLLCRSVYSYVADRARHRVCLSAFLLWTTRSFQASFLDRHWDSFSSLKSGQVSWMPIKSYQRPRGCSKMQGRNLVLEALAKPQFEAIKVGSAFYREIHVPESVRTYTDTPQWDQKQLTAARREEMQRRRDTKESEVSARAFTDSKDGGEEKAVDGAGGGGTSMTREQDSSAALRMNQEERECSVGPAVENAGTGDNDPLESAGTSFCLEEGPSIDASGTKWILKLHTRTPLHQVVVGKKQAKLVHIGKQYNVRATARYDVPRFVIRLEAAERDALLRAREHMRELVAKNKESIPYTHFVSLPLTDPRFQARYHIFKTQVIAAYPNFDEALFPNPEHLHITVLLLRLITDEEEARCKSILESISGEIYDAVDTRSLVLHLKGLEIMNDDPSAASVVFTSQYTGNEKDSETCRRLRRLCSVVAEAFRAGGFLSEEEMKRQQLDALPGEDGKQKLHATLLNSKLRLNIPHGRQLSRTATADAPHTATQFPSASNTSFDATELLCNFKLFDFFECRVSSVALVARARYSAEGNAVVAASVRLP